MTHHRARQSAFPQPGDRSRRGGTSILRFSSRKVWESRSMPLSSHYPAAVGSDRLRRGRTHLSGETVMDLRVHLKVCEACGCLWYRAQIDAKVYCTQCHERFKDFPTPESRKRRGRPRKVTLPTVFAVAAAAFGG